MELTGSDKLVSCGGLVIPGLGARTGLLYVVFQTIGWAAWAVISALSWSSGSERLRSLESYSLYAVYSVFCTHGIRYLLKERQWRDLAWVRMIPRLIGIVSLASSVAAISFYWINLRGLSLSNMPEAGWVKFAEAVGMNSAILYGVWVAVYMMFHSIHRWREAEVQRLSLALALREAELRSLTEQVKPHFLFNSLNGIRALITIDHDQAVDGITRLASLLRYNLSNSRSTVSLREEVDVIRDYLALERIRFRDRLQVQMEIDPQCLGACIPRMSVQHLVENAIKHGIAHLPNGGLVVVTIKGVEHAVKIRIENSGRLNDHGDGQGTGLENTRQRLRLLYGDDQNAKCGVRETAGRVVAELSVPAQVPITAMAVPNE